MICFELIVNGYNVVDCFLDVEVYSYQLILFTSDSMFLDWA